METDKTLDALIKAAFEAGAVAGFESREHPDSWNGESRLNAFLKEWHGHD